MKVSQDLNELDPCFATNQLSKSGRTSDHRFLTCEVGKICNLRYGGN